MPSGPLGGPVLASKEVSLVFRIERDDSLEPTELETQKKVAEIRGPDTDVVDIDIEALEDGDLLVYDELGEIELSLTQMQITEDQIEEELAVNVRSTFIQVK